MDTHLISHFVGTRVLVTGGAGFVGSNLVKRLLACGVERIRVVDNLLSSEKENLPLTDERIEFVEDSIGSPIVLDRIADEYDYVFHLSTYHGNQSSIRNPLADHEHNLLPTLMLCERLKSFQKLRRVVYAAAGCAVAAKTYDRASATPEDAPISLDMDSPYSISKIVGEFYAVYYHRQHGLPTVRARFQNVYGPGEVLGAGQWRGTPATVWRNVTPTFIYKALKSQALPIEGSGDASRDFIYVADIVEGLVRCAAVGRSGDVYNLASGVETSIHDLATAVNAATGNPIPPKKLPPRSWDHSGKRFGSTEKAKQELGFSAQWDLRSGLAATVSWTVANLAFIESCMMKHAAHMGTSDGPI